MSRIMILRSTMKLFLISMLLLAPSVNGMVAERALESVPMTEELLLKGCKPLHIAAYFDEVDTIEQLLTAGAEIEAVNTDGQTALHVAAGRGNRAAVIALLRKDAKINALDRDGYSPLYEATYRRQLGTIQLLLNAGALVVGEGFLKRSPLHRAVLNGDMVAFDLIQARCVNAMPQGCWSSFLHCAAENGSRVVIEFFIRLGENVADRDAHGKTPFLVAAANGHVDAMSCFLENGATLTEEDLISRRAAIHFVAKEGHVGALEFLLSKRVDVNCVDISKTTPLMFAVSNGHVRVAELLLQSGATVASCQDLLTSAARGGKIEMLELILNNGALLDEPDSEGDRALIEAAKAGHEFATKFLLDRGAEIACGNSHHRNALHEAAGQGHVEVSRILLAGGADVEELLDRSYTPLHYAACAAQVEAVELLLSNGASLKRESILFLNYVIRQECDQRRLKCIRVLIDAKVQVHPDSIRRVLNNLAVVRMLINANPECINNVYPNQKPETSLFLRLPDDVEGHLRNYCKSRAFYVEHRQFKDFDNPDTVFIGAAYFLDLEVMKIFEKRWLKNMRSWRDPDGNNLARAALEIYDGKALSWFLKRNIGTNKDVDPHGKDLLCMAIEREDGRLIKEVLHARAKAHEVVTINHIECARSCNDYQILPKLILMYRFSECPAELRPRGLNLF